MTRPEPPGSGPELPAWARTARSRRLLFVAGLVPGLACVALGPALAQDPGLLACGVLLTVLAVAVRRTIEERCAASEARRPSAEPAPHPPLESST